MRFGVFIAILMTFTATAWAGPGQTYSLENQKHSLNAVSLTRQISRAQNIPQTLPGFNITRAASNLGEISAIAMAEKGTLFIADSAKGRIMRLSDRGLDGAIDKTQIHISGLTQPSGLAVVEDTLYIADALAIWRMPVGGGTLEKFVSLENTGAASRPRPLLANSINNQIWIGLNTSDNMAKIIAVDLNTRRADPIASGTGEITALTGRLKGPYWAGLSGSLVPIVKGQALDEANGQSLEPGAAITGLMIPGQYGYPADWPESYREHVFAAQGGDTRLPPRSSGGLNVVTIPTEFGQPAAEMQVLMDGFLARSRRSAWGQPAAMIMDDRGLFIADSWSGTLWRLSKAPDVKPVIIIEPEPEPEIPIEASTETEDVTTEDDGMLRGSGIGAGSHIDSASKLNLGSTIVRDYDAKEKEKAEAEDKKSGKPRTLDKKATKHSLD